MNKTQRQSLHEVLSELTKAPLDDRLQECVVILQPLLDPTRKRARAILPRHDQTQIPDIG